MKVEIWSDVVCPWCYVGKRNFEAALAEFPHRDEVEVVWRSFELDPHAPTTREMPYAERLAKKYGMSAHQAQAMIDNMTARGASAGLDMRFEISKPGNTFDAHRLIHLAAHHGIQDAVKERLLRATFTEGEPIGDHDALVRLAVDAGLPEDEVREVLAGDAFADEVRADEQQATDLDITGVPFFVVDGRFGVSGAQPAETLRRVLDHAWEQSRPVVTLVGGGDGPGCEGESCAM
jgi:predicted DsbA family dithiol-disulfide isomerase